MSPHIPPRPVLLLDVMDTLVRDPFRDTIPAFFEMTLDELLCEKHPSTWVEFERGALTPTECYARLFADGRSFDHAGFEQAVQAAYDWIDGIEPLLEELSRAGAEMYALSNYPVWYRMVDDRLGLSRYLRWSFVSCRTGYRKPAAEAFLHAAGRLQRRPEECLFVDDREANCEAARRVGMDAIRFESAGALRDALVARGLLRAP